MKILGLNITRQQKPAEHKAELAAKTLRPADRDNEVGVAGPGDYYFRGEKITIGTKEPKVADLIYMRKNDGTAASLYNILTLPILSNDFEFVPAPEDAVKQGDAEVHPQRDFVEDCLTLPPYKGGMTTPINLVMADMLRAVVEGFRLFEIVWRLDAQGRIVPKKLASREPNTLTLLRDDRGGFAGAKQNAYIGDKYKSDIEIPVERCFLFTFGKEKNNIEGESAFRAAYYHYDKKHRAYYLAHQQLQQAAISPKVLKSPKGATKTDKEDNLTAIDQMAVRSTAVIPDGWELDIPNISNGKVDAIPLIDHHNAEMARSVLAQFLMLGTASGDTGSYALANTHSDIFIMALKGLMQNIEDHINSYLIPKIVEYNFDQPAYPQFRFKDLTNSTMLMLTDTFNKIMDKRPGAVPDWVIGDIVERVAKSLEIDVPEGADGMTNSDGTPVSKDVESGGGPALSRSGKKKVGLANSRRWFRQLTPAESKVDFAGIQTKENTLEAEFMDAVKPIFAKMRAAAIKQITPLLEAKDIKGLDSFSLKFSDEYIAVIKQQMLDAYLYAKVGAADELGRKAPATPAASKQLINQQAQAIVDKQLSDLNFEIKATITTAIRKNQLSRVQLSVGDVLASIGAAWDAFFESKVGITAGLIVSTAINLGRDDVYQTYRNNIQSYQYSAILDQAVCPICEDLDGKVVTEAEYRSTPWMPPIHFNCRCIWVAIGADEEEPPEITGLPDMPGGTEMPQLSHNHHHVSRLQN